MLTRRAFLKTIGVSTIAMGQKGRQNISPGPEGDPPDGGDLPFPCRNPIAFFQCVQLGVARFCSRIPEPRARAACIVIVVSGCYARWCPE